MGNRGNIWGKEPTNKNRCREKVVGEVTKGGLESNEVIMRKMDVDFDDEL